MYEFDYLKDLGNAKTYLADHLTKGTLVLFLGAGASTGFGLPNWFQLIEYLRDKSGLPYISNYASAEDLQKAADQVKNKVGEERLKELIEECLYKDIDTSIAKSLSNKLLVSVSALLMGSKRGHISRVVTLNYDNMLEWFLSIFGFVVKTVSALPDLEGSEDVRIYHPHGFIPNPNAGQSKSNFIILGLASANRRLGTPGDAWFEMVRHILNTGVCLFVGMSPATLSDRALAPLFQTVGEEHVGKRPLGIWIVGQNITSDVEQEYASNNIIPIQLASHDDIPEFILEICQIARKNIL